MAKKKGLGRGLDALFADAAPIFEEDYLEEKEVEENTETESKSKKETIAELTRQKSGKSNSKSKSSSSETEKKNKNKKAENEASVGKSGDKMSPDKVKEEDSAGLKDREDDEDRIIYIDINDIKPNVDQPRKKFDENKLKELAESIKVNGVIQPLIVRRSGDIYELVAGERRWRASRLAELKKVPCIIRNFDDKQNAIVAIIENMQRENLDPIEEAQGLKSMTEKFGFTQEQVSNSLGKSRTYITNSIRLLKLPQEIQDYIVNGQISAAHGRTVINVNDEKKQKEICEKIIKEGLSVRATEKIAEKAKDEIRPDRKKRKTKKKEEKSVETVAVEAELRKLTGTKVNIAGNGKSGRLELEFYSTDELNRLIELIREAFK